MIIISRLLVLVLVMRHFFQIIAWNGKLPSLSNPSATTADRHHDSKRRSFLASPIGIFTAANIFCTNIEAVAADPNPFPSRTNVFWHAAKRQALQANPSTIRNIFSSEMLGPTHINGLLVRTTGIICVSERHDDFEHHLIQLRCIQSLRSALRKRVEALSSQNPSEIKRETLSIGMECFQRSDRRFLNKFISSPESYTINDLKRDTNWDTNWGYDMLHYVPILNYAQEKGIQLFGLHPSNELVEAVLNKGLTAVPESTINGVNTSDQKHLDSFREMTLKRLPTDKFGGCAEFAETHIRRLYEVQCFREEYMAESASLHINQRGGWAVVLAGENHIKNRRGIPFRALRRMSARWNKSHSASGQGLTASAGAASNRGVFTILPKTESFPVEANDAPGISSADYVWYVERDPSSFFDASVVNKAPRRAA